MPIICLAYILSAIFFAAAPMIAVSSDETKMIYKDAWLQMIVEIPAGTSKKIEYNKDYNKFIIEKKNGFDRVINFLPYPANYGFIPSTKMDIERGGDGDALDIILISESVETGAIIDVIPIAVLNLQDSEEIDTKIVAVPVEKELRIISATTYEDLIKDYAALKVILKLWFTNYKGDSVVTFIKWGDEVEARAEIAKWSLK